ncbi:MAG: DUF262 domain-containing protein [Gammaproteobacteria bacterium]|nr:DUF262 domain-containing protein [Gammaproteobacteria bacterium]
MLPEQNYIKIEELLHWKHLQVLKTNHEYQRGQVWSKFQEKMFIDSILRKYPVPAIYLHKRELDIGGGKINTHYEIIDGQQRIEALHKYTQGNFPLINPANSRETKFPKFLREQECPWAGKRYNDLPEEQKTIIMETKVPCATIQSDTKENEIRDLFIRLQAGLPLNPQEKRDAWPGRFTEFILEVGGKRELLKYPGESFFHKVMGINPGTGRGRARTTAAQLYILYESHHENKRFEKTGSEDIDAYYHANVDFDKESDTAKRFRRILKDLEKIHIQANLPKLSHHAAIHLIVLVDTLMNDGVSKWSTALGNAYSRFNNKISEARAMKDPEDQSKNEYWLKYAQFTERAANDPATIERRNVFFFEKVLRFMEKENAPTFKDQRRSFIAAEREYIFFRDEKKCLICDSEVVWREAEIHHVTPYAEGGKTEIDNGALVHRICHPKTESSIKRAKEKFKQKETTRHTKDDNELKSRKGKEKIKLPPGTEAQAFYQRETYHAKIDEKGRWKGEDWTEKSPSSAIMSAIQQRTGKRPSLNGYEYWEIKQPGEEHWRPLKSLREENKG